MARVLAGGTDLLVQKRIDRFSLDLIVDIKRIAGMRSITAKAGGFPIGAAVAGAVLGEHKALRKARRGIVEAANPIGSPQIQSRATLASTSAPRFQRPAPLSRNTTGRCEAAERWIASSTSAAFIPSVSEPFVKGTPAAIAARNSAIMKPNASA